MRTLLAVFCSAVVFAGTAAAVTRPALGADAPTPLPPQQQPPPSQSQPLTFAAARADFDKGDYKACLGKISKLLTTGAYKSDSPERYDLLMLRGECLLQLKQRPGAQAAF